MRQKTFCASNLFWSLMLIVCLTVVASAQFRAGIQGTISDAAEAVIPGATVTLTNNETGQIQQAVTADTGFYRFSALPPGVYTIAVEQQSFKKRVIENVKVDAEAVRGVDVQLEAGGISEVVTVEAENAPLDTEDANVRRTISDEEVQRLPQAGRDPYELVRLAPGVFGAGARSSSGGAVGLPNTSGPGGSNEGIFQTENRPAVSANGQRVSANNFQIDGVSVNSQTWGGAAVITPTQEAVKEVQVTSSSYSAEDGRNSGAQIKVVSQNGTNRFRGSAFFKYNDPGWNAFTPTVNIVGSTRRIEANRVETRNKTFGGSFGGPIVPNKLFFFFAYEGGRVNNTDIYEAFIETDQLRQFIVGRGGISAQIVGAENSRARVVSILPAACANYNFFGTGNRCRDTAGGLDLGSPAGALGRYVSTTTPVTGGPTRAQQESIGGGFDGVPDIQRALLIDPGIQRGDQYVNRLDYQMTKTDKFQFSLFLTPRFASGADRAAQSRPMADINSKRLNYNTAFTYIRNFSPTILNEARVNFTRWAFDEINANPDTNFGIPRVEIQNFATNNIIFGAPRGANTPGTLKETQFNIRDTLTLVRGNHAVKIGADYRSDRNENPGAGAARPVYTFRGPWNFANGAPVFEQISAGFNGEPLAGQADFNTGGLAFFVQDDWKFRPNLTLNFGLRWEYFKPVTSEDGLGNLELGPNGLVDSRVVVKNKLWNSDYNNFGPQIGFAYTPKFLKDKVVLRGGFGLGYDRLPNSLPSNARRNPPNVANYAICCGSANTPGESPFANGQIIYALGSSNSPTSYPINPNIGRGINPLTGGPNVGTIELYDINDDFKQSQVVRYSLETQAELFYKLVGTIGYQGSRSRNFVRIEPLHLTTEQRSTVFTQVFLGVSDVSGSYNAMNARLQRRFSNGVQFDLNYRFSKSLDSYSFEAPCSCTNQTFPIEQSQEYGPSDFDVRHNITLSGLYDLPIFRGQKTLAGKLLGGWQIGGVLTHHTGFPWTATITSGSIVLPNGAGFANLRPVAYTGQQPLSNTNDNFLSAGGLFPGSLIYNANNQLVSCGAATGGCNRYFQTYTNGNSYVTNPPGVGRNSFFGPKYFDVDMSLQKRFGLPNVGFLGENSKFDVRFNFFNIFNNLNIAPIQSASSNRANNPNFSEGTALLAGRVVEFQARFSF